MPGPYRPMIGFYAPRSHRVVEQHDCLLQPEIFRTVVDIVGRWAKHTGLPIYDETTGKGILRHLYIREAEATGEIQVCLVCTSGKLPDTHALIDSLRREVPGLVSVMVNLNREDTNVVLGGKGFVLWGREWITDELWRPAVPFITAVVLSGQPPAGGDPLRHRGRFRVARAGGHGARPLLRDRDDRAFHGEKSGTDRRRGDRGQAVEDAKRNAEENGIENARFLCADAEEAAGQLLKEGIRPAAVILTRPARAARPGSSIRSRRCRLAGWFTFPVTRPRWRGISNALRSGGTGPNGSSPSTCSPGLRMWSAWRDLLQNKYDKSISKM